jgi:acetate CoA/acetoacetate CoA-transferase beta subunit
LVTGARRVIVAMTHTAKGEHKIVEALTLPLTSVRCVDLIVTEMAVLRPTPEGMVLQELAPGLSIEQVQAATGTRLIVRGEVPVMAG